MFMWRLLERGPGFFYGVLLPPLFSPARMRRSKNWQIGGGGGRGGRCRDRAHNSFYSLWFCGDSHVAVRESRGLYICPPSLDPPNWRRRRRRKRHNFSHARNPEVTTAVFSLLPCEPRKNKASNLFYSIVFPFNAKPETPHVNSQKFEAATLFSPFLLAPPPTFKSAHAKKNRSGTWKLEGKGVGKKMRRREEQDLHENFFS